MKNISVIGAGTMGNGIAHVFALSGYSVNLVAKTEEALEKAINIISKNLDRQIEKSLISIDDKTKTLFNIKTFTDLKSAVSESDLVIEAITENEILKIQLFEQLSSFCKKTTILASNTSSISISKIASIVDFPDRVIGMHFMNPVPVMKLVEIINGKKSNKAITLEIVKICQLLNKVPVVVNDSPGFIANRILMPMINEAIISLEEGVAGVAEIDEIMKLGMAHPMGPLQLADLIGLDVCCSILEVLHEGLGEKYKPASLLSKLVASKKLGIKTGEGFYTYTKGSKDLVVSLELAQLGK
jgi:3-hydroxybutyryl-CoA dehydrogenase